MAAIDQNPEELDRAPTTKMEQSDEEDTRIPPPPEMSPWKVYLQPKYLSQLLSKNKLIYGFWVGFYYLAQFIGCVATVNLYSDVDRLTPCSTTGDLADPEEASKVFDMPLKLLAIWHMIEWIRTTVLLTVICIGVNWTIFWYATIPNSLFGIVVYALVHMVYFDADGEACAEVQKNRAAWLLGEIIAFWVVFFFFVFPFIWTFVLGKAKADATLLKAYKEAAEESDGEEPEEK